MSRNSHIFNPAMAEIIIATFIVESAVEELANGRRALGGTCRQRRCAMHRLAGSFGDMAARFVATSRGRR